jgi:hypothetical protein
MHPIDPAITRIYHITDLSNLDAILTNGELWSDARMRKGATPPTRIGYANIKERRLTRNRIPCCGNRFVGEFVPFYFCPRSPMLCAINNGLTGRIQGCQKTIVHLVSTVQKGYDLQRAWAISDGNAGACYTTFSNDRGALDGVNWEVVQSWDWKGDRMHAKATEFLIADRFPVSALTGIGCYDAHAAAAVKTILAEHGVDLPVAVCQKWYY